MHEEALCRACETRENEPENHMMQSRIGSFFANKNRFLGVFWGGFYRCCRRRCTAVRPCEVVLVVLVVVVVVVVVVAVAVVV